MGPSRCTAGEWHGSAPTSAFSREPAEMPLPRSARQLPHTSHPPCKRQAGDEEKAMSMGGYLSLAAFLPGDERSPVSAHSGA